MKIRYCGHSQTRQFYRCRLLGPLVFEFHPAQPPPPLVIVMDNPRRAWRRFVKKVSLHILWCRRRWKPATHKNYVDVQKWMRVYAQLRGKQLLSFGVPRPYVPKTHPVDPCSPPPPPREHETVTRCWFNAGPPSTQLGQQWTNIGSMYLVCCHGIYFSSAIRTWHTPLLPSKIRHIKSMLG